MIKNKLIYQKQSHHGKIYTLSLKIKMTAFGKQSLKCFSSAPDRQQYKHFNTR